MYFYTHIGNTLFIDDTPYKIMFNRPYSAIFWDFDDFRGEDHYLLKTIIPYLEFLHLFGYGVFTYVKHNPFGRIEYINCDDPKQFKMLFVNCNNGCKPSFCNNAKLNMKQKNTLLIVHLDLLVWKFK